MGHKGYKPTLGGVKKVQEFLAQAGYPMPVVHADIGNGTDRRFKPGKRQTVAIDSEIKKHGATLEVENVRLENKQGDMFILFSSRGYYRTFAQAANGRDLLIEFSPGNSREFRDFMRNGGKEKIRNLARWGKENPSKLDRIMFKLFPKLYGNGVFRRSFA